MYQKICILALVWAIPIHFASIGVTAESVPASASNAWINVTPGGVDLNSALDCDNYGSISMVVDPARPSNVYTQFHCQGIWKSVDYGLSWSGPINNGHGGAGASGAGGIAIARGQEGQPPVLYSAGIRGTGLGFWKSTDGGVSWLKYRVSPGGDRQDFYPPTTDPLEPNHLIMTGHEMNLIVESHDGGKTWLSIPMADGMRQTGGTGFVFFINTGTPATTAKTWLWTAQGSGGEIGTWRTTSGGQNWVRVDSNEHPHGQMQIYQPDASGIIYMPGIYSALGNGVLRSADYGGTWTHVGLTMNEASVFGTARRIHAMYGWACGDCSVDPAHQSAPQPGISGWARMPTPPDMTIGPAQAVTTFDGTNYIILTANWRRGLWRFIE